MELIHSVFEFSETPVKKVMVPRPKIFALDVNTPPEDAEQLVVESGFSRIPGVRGGRRRLRRRRLHQGCPAAHRAAAAARAAEDPAAVHFVPETKKVGALLKELQKRRTHLAMVVDEHGSVTGLVTMEDLLEEIVGEIQDEYDWEERPVERLRDGSLVVEGTTPASELREAYHIPIPPPRSSTPSPASC
jgi:CBS domain containing-hemolysin-like protein